MIQNAGLNPGTRQPKTCRLSSRLIKDLPGRCRGETSHAVCVVGVSPAAGARGLSSSTSVEMQRLATDVLLSYEILRRERIAFSHSQSRSSERLQVAGGRVKTHVAETTERDNYHRIATLYRRVD